MKDYRHYLQALIDDLPIPSAVTGETAAVVITGIAFDSRQVKPGDLFVCLYGGTTDGHKYIPDVIKLGAAAVVGCARAFRFNRTLY